MLSHSSNFLNNIPSSRFKEILHLETFKIQNELFVILSKCTRHVKKAHQTTGRAPCLRSVLHRVEFVFMEGFLPNDQSPCQLWPKTNLLYFMLTHTYHTTWYVLNLFRRWVRTQWWVRKVKESVERFSTPSAFIWFLLAYKNSNKSVMNIFGDNPSRFARQTRLGLRPRLPETIRGTCLRLYYVIFSLWTRINVYLFIFPLNGIVV